MALATFIPAAVILPNSGGTITQLEDIPFDPAFEDLVVHAAGSTFPGFSGSNNSKVVYNLSTSQIKTILDYATNEAITRAHTTGNGDIEYQAVADLGTRQSAAGLVHQRHRMTRSMLAWDSIDAPESGIANISFKILPTSTDDTNPVTVTDGVAMASSAVVADVFGLGPVKIDGTLYCVDKWSLNMGIEYQLKFCSGGAYLRWVAAIKGTPVLTATIPNQAEALANWATGGAAIGTSVIAFLRKRAAGAISVAAATAEHISITGTAGSVKPVGRNEVKITLHNIAIDTTSAIA